MKKVREVWTAPPRHWVGDGFPVRSLFGYGDGAEGRSPFLLLDHAGPQAFAPAESPRGVGAHPHRGFETVTIVYQGEVAHRDSTGAGGTIGPGDVQWMTAGAGIVHEELHSHDFTRRGGTLEMAQLWVNLPAAEKEAAPGYQALRAADIPVIALPGGAGTARVIAGNLEGAPGPAHTRSPMSVLDVRLAAGRRGNVSVTDGWTTLVTVLHGAVRVDDDRVVQAGQGARLDRRGETMAVEAESDAALLVLDGRPLGEPVVGQGPFVMNTREEIEQAITDFRAGRFGSLAG